MPTRPRSSDESSGQLLRLSDAHHDYACMPCGSRGGPCLEALWLAQRVAGGVAARARDLPAGSGLTASTRFGGCGHDCAVRLQLLGLRIEVLCWQGPAPGAPQRPSAKVTAVARDSAPLVPAD